MDGDSQEQQALLEQLTALREQHDELNREVDMLSDNGVVDQLKIARLKKEKLRLKDEIARLEDQITPDIIA
ncbi:YdcH family protein [Maricaulis sp.]|uniref:YdcH family protein n=1 Tax=Maricaulis sp. TaxID=1486257 RepID=UPI001B0718BB|nr:YdcH family protein [Maricaulis sp.]MBO6764205.1 YdcH family protein [Maricaulis sp.]